MYGLRPPARVLDLGCGAGLPVSRELFGRGFQVTGVDGSACQIARARQNVSQARFIHADMTSISFPSAYFEAIGAFYSITHVPRDEHAMLLGHIANWLSAGGRFVGSFGASAVEGWTGEWLGTTMFISCFDIDTTKRLVADAGLTMKALKFENKTMKMRASSGLPPASHDLHSQDSKAALSRPKTIMASLPLDRFDGGIGSRPLAKDECAMTFKKRSRILRLSDRVP